MIWQRIPKTVFVGASTFQLGVYDAVAHFNIGNKATIKVLEALGMTPGTFFAAAVKQADCLRVNRANYKSKDTTKTRSKVLRGQRKKQGGKNKEKEGKTYSFGRF